ncbi:MAG: DUF1156 domain-containing protein [Chloroflexi bacterium]|nr:DUF1156 domain-containing protein [Chloroflexota bacterium]
MPTTTQTPYRKKLIEVDLPLDAINRESAREKTASARKGHPSTLHRWWARRPLVACRAIAFATIVDDPGEWPELFESVEARTIERERLHDLISRLVDVDTGANEDVLNEAIYEMAVSLARSNNDDKPLSLKSARAYVRDNAPTVYDPFCGGGSIPLESQRLGINTIATDLNPVAVLISKAMLDFPHSTTLSPPINQHSTKIKTKWRRNAGLAEDIRHYGSAVRKIMVEKVGHLYPKTQIDNHNQAITTFWIWFRTMRCPNPACGVDMPITKSFQLSAKKSNEKWVLPLFDSEHKRISYRIQSDDGNVPVNGTINRTSASCVVCSTSLPIGEVRKAGISGRFGETLIATVAKSGKSVYFREPDAEHYAAMELAEPSSLISGKLPDRAVGLRTHLYGFTNWKDHFNRRQTTYLTKLVETIRQLAEEDSSELSNDHMYRSVIKTYLTLTLGRMVDHSSSFNRWDNKIYRSVPVFSRQSLSMIWDYAEINPFGQNAKDWSSQVDWIADVVERLPDNVTPSIVKQGNAAENHNVKNVIYITDPPYYDNILYSESSDFFYVWHRSVLKDTFSELYGGMLTPKFDELVSNRFLHDDAPGYFESRMRQALTEFRETCHEGFPSSIIYGYKQQTTDEQGSASTGWERMLNAAIGAGFMVTGTWPIRSENPARPRANRSNALATSVTIVLRPRPETSRVATRHEFLEDLNAQLTTALDRLTRDGHIAPADMPQAAIGPGMEIYSKFSRVETISGEPVSVRDALQQINRVIGEYFDREEGELDVTSRFCVDWLKTHGHNEASYGDAENIARAKNLSVSDITNIHQLADNEPRGIIQLHPISEYHPDRKYPMTDITAWEGCMRMAYHLDTSNEDGEGVEGCGKIGRLMAGNIDSIERLARILYNHYDNLNQPRDAYIYNQLVSEWQNILDEVQRPDRRTLV